MGFAPPRSALFFISLIYIIIVYGPHLSALPAALNYQVQTGHLDVSHTGSFNGHLNLGSTVDLAAEVLNDDSSSLIGHGIISLDANSAIMKYMYAGVGRRLYLYSHPTQLDLNMDMSKITIVPKRQYFITFEAGLGQVNVFSLTTSLSSIATVFEYGASVGVNLPISSHIAFTSSLGYSQGYGFSSVTINSKAIKALFGLNIR